MPISIRFLIAGAFSFPWKVRFEPAPPPREPSESEEQRALAERELSGQLPPRLLRDVLRD
jgi:hypothetical protein